MTGKTPNYNCAASNCYNSSITHPEYAYFFIPQTEERRIEWLRRIDRADWIDNAVLSKCRRVCEVHFAPDDIIYTNNKKGLKKSAVPTRCIAAKYVRNAEVKSEFVESSSNTVRLTSKFSQTNFNDCIKTITSTASQTNIDLSTSIYHTRFHELCNTYLTEELTQFIKADAYISNKSVENREVFRNLCWNIYLPSPPAYQFLQRLFDLPTASSLVKQYIRTGTGINDNFMLTMKTKVDKMNKKEKNCCVVIGVTELKASLCYNIKEDKIIGFGEINSVQYPSPTKRAVIIMICGILSCWKQPFGYILIPESGYDYKIDDWIGSVLMRLFDIGLDVRAVISTLNDDFVNKSQMLKEVSVENPYFIMNGKKIFHIYDAIELMKAVRNNLMVNNFQFDKNVVKYKHIVDFHNKDLKKHTPVAPKVTNSHISPTDTEIGQGIYAIQLLSASVARGIWNFADFGLIDGEGKDTAEFISKIDNLFDLLNATKRQNEDNSFKEAFCGKENQTLFLEEMIALFQNLKILNLWGEDVASAAKFINGFLTTIKSTMLLFNDLKLEGHTCLPTRNLQSECLINFFTRKAAAKRTKKFTSQQFITKYRKLFFVYHKKLTLSGRTKDELSKCVKLINEKQEKERKEPEVPMIVQNPIPSIHYGTVKVQKGDYMEIDTPEKHTLFYICGYLLMKSKENHSKCPLLLDYMRSMRSQNPSSNFTHERYMQYEHPEKLLAVPCDSFVNFVEQMDRKFIQAFETQEINFKIAESVFNAIQQIDCKLPCECFPKTYMITLFLRIKIFYTVRFNNREFRKKKGNLKFTVPRLE